MSHPELFQALATATDYRSFLKEAFEFLKQKNPQFGFASFSRKAGFAARSLPRDVLMGKKITAKTLPGFILGLGLKGPAAQYFSLLVFKEHPEEMLTPLNATVLNNRLLRLKEKLKKNEAEDSPNQSSVYRQLDWPDVYASLGSASEGSRLEDVSFRAGIGTKECRRILDSMIENGLVDYDQDLEVYKTNQQHLFFEKLGSNDDFKKYFIHLMSGLNKSAQQQFNREDALYFASTVSIRKDRMTEFKSRLRDLLSNFVEDIDHNKGDRVAHLACAFQPKD